MVSPLIPWKKCLGSLCIAIWIFPIIVIAAVLVTDDEAAKKNLDSIYIGTIVTTINSTSKPTSCIPSTLKFGPFSSSRFILGPNHNGWYEPNPFFLALVGGEEGEFLTSLQSSLTSKKRNETWWTVQAWQNGGIGHGAYHIEGTMIFDVDDDIGEERNQLSGVWEVGKGSKTKSRRNDRLQHLDDTKGEDEGEKEDKEKDLCAKGRKELLRWKHKKSTTILRGQVGAKEANIQVTGQVVLTLGSGPDDDNQERDPEEGDDEKSTLRRMNRLGRRQETQDMTYTVIFSGKHHSGSAPLPTQGLVWREAGSGPPMEQFKFFVVEPPRELDVSTTTSSTKSSTTKSSSTSKPTTKKMPTPTHSDKPPTASNPSITNTPTDDTKESDPPGNPEGPLPKGAVVGIVVGGVIGCLAFAVMLFFLRQWRAKRKEPKVYPELAYIYSTPFTSTNKRSGGTGGDGGAGASTAYLTGSRATTSHHEGTEEAGTYYGPAAPQLEVDLGGRAPFLDSSDAGAAGARGLGSQEQQQQQGVGGYNQSQDADDLEEEMRQPMLPGAIYYDSRNQQQYHHDQYHG